MQKENIQNNKSDQALKEEEVLKFWRENEVFEKSLQKESPKGEFIFYEGPPTANGKPGIHHLEARAFKDAIPRYKTMQGYHVRRKGGWDTHGLPVELQVEKKLGLDSKKAIEEYGIGKFNQECKESVWEYVDLWSKFTTRIGYWVDQENPYVTYHNEYIESVWNILKHTSDQGLLYKDYKVLPWCPRCGTALSSHELAQGYEDVKDLSVTAKFRVNGQDNTYILAWTTTPWTLPGNVALAVGKDIEYIKFEKTSEPGFFYIASKNYFYKLHGNLKVENPESGLIKDLKFEPEYNCIEALKGSDLVGLSYEPLYPYLSEMISESEKPKLEKAYKVYDADFVTTEDGTGVVHTAVMYGQDDFVLGTDIGLPKEHVVGLDGKYLSGTGSFEGRFVKDEDVAVDIIKDLAHRGLLFKKEKYEHSYPHCWRCKTALIYYARESWYIRMSELKDKLVEENKSINWEPEHIRDGRFGEWLKDIKDWAISRERYWGTPLPVWNCDTCKQTTVVGSLADFKDKVKKSGNTYFMMRHGQTHFNIEGIVSNSVNNEDHLTDLGKKQSKESAESIKKENIDMIICSPFARTVETAEIAAEILGINKDDIVTDDRLHEMSVPMYEGRLWEEYHNDFPNTVANFDRVLDGNESYMDVRVRVMSFLYDLEKKYSDKKILIITHGGPLWLAISGVQGLSIEETLRVINDKKAKDYNYLPNGTVTKLDFAPIPHNEKYELDLHRPYIDEVDLVCAQNDAGQACGGKLVRAKEVMDVWFDSGAMPFAQDHYLFDFAQSKPSDSSMGKSFENKNLPYPADFISEAIDQTRGWFYTLHAIGVLMGKGKAYKNVICLGHLLDANGKKMSKSLGNIVDPWIMMDRYGVDTLRLWMYSVNQPGESKNFDEKTVSELHNKFFNLLYNVLAFYELYRERELELLEYKASKNILDKWIVARFHKLASLVAENMDKYKLLEPVRAMRDFIDDLSTWYVRRSRERLREGDKEAKETLYYVLKNLTKLIAPFAPFAGEDIWQKLKNKEDAESVHLADWPKAHKHDDSLIDDMQKLRNIVTLGLEARQRANIKVRQPLAKISVKDWDLSDDYTEILKDELNVKEVIKDKSIENEVELDTHLTLALRQEGQYRELVRAIQDIRKQKGLNPNDMIVLNIETSIAGQELINQFKIPLLKTVGADDIVIIENNGEEVKIDELLFKVQFVR